MEETQTPSTSDASITKLPHHERAPLCTTRPAYRQGKKLTAVKVQCGRWIEIVYTVNEESQHLLIRGVPALNLQRELKNLCMKYGEVKFLNLIRNYSKDEEQFTEVYHVLFKRIQSARFAKHMIDDRSFYGGILHVCYAPELETVSETKNKLLQRKRDVLKRIKKTHLTKTMLKDTESQNIPRSSVNNNVPQPRNVSNQPVRQCKPSVLVQPVAPLFQEDPSTSSFFAHVYPSCHEPSNNHLSLKSVPRRRPASNIFIPTQVKRIRFNKPS